MGDSKIQKLNQFLQIIAIILGGLWGILVFTTSVYPSLQTNVIASLSAETEWYEEREVCRSELQLRLQNLSKSSSEIEGVILSGFFYEYPLQPPKEYFLDVWHPVSDPRNRIFIGPQDENGLKLPVFVGEQIEPEGEAWISFEILHHPVPGEILYVEAEMRVVGLEEKRFASTWVDSCRENDV